MWNMAITLVNCYDRKVHVSHPDTIYRKKNLLTLFIDKKKKNLLIDSLLTPIVKSTYLNIYR